MSDPQRPATDPQPFEGEPVGPATFSGCGKPAVIGCTAVLILLALGLLVIVWKAGDLVRWSLGQYRETVIEHLPDDVTAADRERLEAAFDAALEALTSGRADPAGLQDLQRAMSATGRRIQNLSRDDVLELTRALERVAGGGEPAPEAAPELEPGAVPEPGAPPGAAPEPRPGSVAA